MMVNTNAIVSMTEANQNFSRVTHIADANGLVVVFKNNRPKYLLIDMDRAPLIQQFERDIHVEKRKDYGKK